MVGNGRMWTVDVVDAVLVVCPVGVFAIEATPGVGQVGGGGESQFHEVN
jgi:hypothetical protein